MQSGQAYPEKIIENKVKCLQCNDIIESTEIQELVTCSCGRITISGAFNILNRYEMLEGQDFTEMSKFYLCIDGNINTRNYLTEEKNEI